MDPPQQMTQGQSSRKKTRAIKKAQKVATLPKTSTGRGRFVSNTTTPSSKIYRSPQATSSHSKQISWFRQLEEWLQTGPRVIQASISTVIQQLPTFKSIDDLFSLGCQEALSKDDDYAPLFRYSRVCSLLSPPDGKVVLLREQGRGAVAVSVGEQGLGSTFSFGMALSESEVRMAEKRSIFMEKLKTNEAKYDNSLGRMSEISKELAFTYRTYLQERKQILDSLRSLQAKVFDENSSFSQTPSQYSRLLIVKNLRHTFQSDELDPFNYFKMREHIESDRIHEFQNISSFDQLSNFIAKRKPKRGRRIGLATACSVCLSDYYELINPLKTCGVCGLRAHQLCYSFEYRRCGNCTFQKMERQLKEVVSCCFICRRAGLMVVKLDDSLYAHGFCLLVHESWHCGEQRDTSKCQKAAVGVFPGACLQNLGSRNSNFIEYFNPLNDSNLKSHAAYYSTTENPIFSQRQQPNEMIPNNPSQVDEIQPFSSGNAPSYPKQFDFIEQAASKEGCQFCGLPFCRDFFISCQRCSRQYHAMCAFLAGFNLSIDQGKYTGSKRFLKLTCCDKDTSRISWNRRFKLNYNRCVFSILPTDLGQRQPTSFWRD